MSGIPGSDPVTGAGTVRDPALRTFDEGKRMAPGTLALIMAEACVDHARVAATTTGKTERTIRPPRAIG
ncbi:hypothetical protein [Gluconobacter wancherniae]|uniref:hypothetical protein n=1 Tax=Gluconobacter wancherniae TaxID=1307955 RepID=UPI001B8CA03A|nr:hypothetical protein [Gluconobacter wancherniae]MBS1089964.1 hypothetical protein [Gluconobacter wancherniae]